MPGHRDVERLGKQTVTLAELPHAAHRRLAAARTSRGGRAIAQIHCHQHAILGFDRDQALLRDSGVDLDVLDAGCCGLAGNFGFEAGHYDVSTACAEQGLSRRSPAPIPAQPSWPTGSPAGPRSKRATSAGRVCT